MLLESCPFKTLAFLNFALTKSRMLMFGILIAYFTEADKYLH